MERYLVGKWTVNPMACTLSCDGSSKQIEPKCMELLVMLIKADGEVVSRTDIMESIWQGRYVTEHVLNNLVATLRKHLRDTNDSDYIKTRPKRGYQLTVPAELIAEANATGSEPLQSENSPTTDADTAKSDASVATIAAKKRHSVLHRAGFASVFVVVISLIGLFWYQQTYAPEPQISIAVMPFDVLDSEQETQHFAEGLVDETIHQLSSTTKLGIASRSSSLSTWTAISDGNADYDSVPFNYVLEGSIRPQQQLLRVTARLVNGQSGNLLWSRVYTVNRTSTLTAQSEISQQLTQTISESLESPETLLALEQSSVPNEAYLHVLRGRKLNSEGKMDSYIKALDEFKMATLIAPNYLDAHADLALNYLILAQQRKMDPDDANRMAYQSIQKALEIDPEHAKSHSMNATYHQNIGEYALAERSYRKALSIDPDLYVAVLNFANMMRLQHRYQESLELYEKAKHLAPRSSGANWAIGSILISLGRLDEAIEQYGQCITLLPEFDACVSGLAYAQRLSGLNEEADKALAKYLDMVKQPHYWSEHVAAWHRYWQNDLDTAFQIYQGLINQHGYAIDGASSLSLLMWQKGDLSNWLDTLNAELQRQQDDTLSGALAYGYYLNDACEQSIEHFETLLKNQPHYFNDLGMMANGFSYRAALAFCYKEVGQLSAFRNQMVDLQYSIESIPETLHQAPGLAFVKGHYMILSEDTAQAISTKAYLETIDAPISWMSSNDPLYRTLLP